eukprot:m.241595 g.241595  ORF g.241595 m.241595 type:complete len:58 (+) comp15327_c0_seq6:3793-3966(+)
MSQSSSPSTSIPLYGRCDGLMRPNTVTPCMMVVVAYVAGHHSAKRGQENAQTTLAYG